MGFTSCLLKMNSEYNGRSPSLYKYMAFLYFFFFLIKMGNSPWLISLKDCLQVNQLEMCITALLPGCGFDYSELSTEYKSL